MFIGIYNKSVILTYIGVASAVFGIYLSVNGSIRYAMLLLVISGVCDLFDGMAARRCKRTDDEKEFGIEIDSLADMINFAVFPVVLFFSLGLNRWYHVIFCIIYALAAITRLGFFNISAQKNALEQPVKYYKGLPVTFAALIFPLLWFCSMFLSSTFFNAVYSASIIIVSILFVLNVKIPKPKGIAYLFLGLLAIAVASALIMIGG